VQKSMQLKATIPVQVSIGINLKTGEPKITSRLMENWDITHNNQRLTLLGKDDEVNAINGFEAIHLQGIFVVTNKTAPGTIKAFLVNNRLVPVTFMNNQYLVSMNDETATALNSQLERMQVPGLELTGNPPTSRISKPYSLSPETVSALTSNRAMLSRILKFWKRTDRHPIQIEKQAQPARPGIEGLDSIMRYVPSYKDPYDVRKILAPYEYLLEGDVPQGTLSAAKGHMVAARAQILQHEAKKLEIDGFLQGAIGKYEESSRLINANKKFVSDSEAFNKFNQDQIERINYMLRPISNINSPEAFRPFLPPGYVRMARHISVEDVDPKYRRHVDQNVHLVEFKTAQSGNDVGGGIFYILSKREDGRFDLAGRMNFNLDNKKIAHVSTTATFIKNKGNVQKAIDLLLGSHMVKVWYSASNTLRKPAATRMYQRMADKHDLRFDGQRYRVRLGGNAAMFAEKPNPIGSSTDISSVPLTDQAAIAFDDGVTVEYES
jgi:hypothetical protein